MTKRNKNRGVGGLLAAIFLGFAALLGTIAYFVRGKTIALIQPKGFISSEQLRLTLAVVAILLIIAIPTLIILYSIAWKYRSTNPKAQYDPDGKHGKFFNFYFWSVPIAVAALIGIMLWPATHRLAPRKVIGDVKDPLKIQVVALRWKWLFIYPEQNIATVNYVAIPVNTPVQFLITADEAPMSSFWVPQLGGQLYAMTGHVNPLNLIADHTGTYNGVSAEINGAGFAGMKFTVESLQASDFEAWVKNTRSNSPYLDAARYSEIVKPSEYNPVDFYGGVDDSLFTNMLKKYHSDGHSMPATSETEQHDDHNHTHETEGGHH